PENRNSGYSDKNLWAISPPNRGLFAGCCISAVRMALRVYGVSGKNESTFKEQPEATECKIL
ncbi:hypothetical protein DM870_26290, partial [Escherichia coli]